MNLYGAFECALHMFACMAQVLNSISMLVWCMLDLKKMIDEMKTSMHRIARHLSWLYKWY